MRGKLLSRAGTSSEVIIYAALYLYESIDRWLFSENAKLVCREYCRVVGISPLFRDAIFIVLLKVIELVFLFVNNVLSTHVD